MIERIQARSEMGRRLDFAVAVGQQEEDYSVLHLLGEVIFYGQTYTVAGTHTLREGRDYVEAELRRLDTGETLEDSAAEDIVVSLMVALDDGREDCLLAREMERICG
jgi:hypothetical protein